MINQLRKRTIKAWMGVAVLLATVVALAWAQTKYEEPASIPLPPRAAPAPGQPLNYRIPMDTTLPPEVARWVRVKPGEVVEYYDSSKQGTTLAKLQTPLKTAIPQDPLQYLTPPANLKGALIYSVYAMRLNQPPQGDFLVKLELKARNATVITYPLVTAADDYIMDPHFLPDGERVLFKLGWPYDSYGFYHLYLLDLKTQKLRKLTKVMLSNENVQISADGNYLAYIRGGDRLGDNQQPWSPGLPASTMPPLQLCVLDIKTGQEHQVIANDSIAAGRFAWTPRDTLLYSIAPAPLPAPSPGRVPTNATEKANTLPRPNIYEVAAKGGKARLLIRDGWRPLPSPDGQWIAFFGSENPKKPEPLGQQWRDNPQGATLSVARSDGSERKAINRENDNYPDVIWKPHSAQLLVLKTAQTGATALATLREFDTTTQYMGSPINLIAQDKEVLPRPVGMLPPFRLKTISSDGTYLFAQVEEYGEQDPVTKMYNRYYTLLQINTQSGTVTPICKLKNAFGMDWYDETPLTSAGRAAKTKSASQAH